MANTLIVSIYPGAEYATKNPYYDFYEHHDHCITRAWSITDLADHGGTITGGFEVWADDAICV